MSVLVIRLLSFLKCLFNRPLVKTGHKNRIMQLKFQLYNCGLIWIVHKRLLVQLFLNSIHQEWTETIFPTVIITPGNFYNIA